MKIVLCLSLLFISYLSLSAEAAPFCSSIFVREYSYEAALQDIARMKFALDLQMIEGNQNESLAQRPLPELYEMKLQELHQLVAGRLSKAQIKDLLRERIQELQGLKSENDQRVLVGREHQLDAFGYVRKSILEGFGDPGSLSASLTPGQVKNFVGDNGRYLFRSVWGVEAYGILKAGSGGHLKLPISHFAKLTLGGKELVVFSETEVKFYNPMDFSLLRTVPLADKLNLKYLSNAEIDSTGSTVAIRGSMSIALIDLTTGIRREITYKDLNKRTLQTMYFTGSHDLLVLSNTGPIRVKFDKKKIQVEEIPSDGRVSFVERIGDKFLFRSWDHQGVWDSSSGLPITMTTPRGRGLGEQKSIPFPDSDKIFMVSKIDGRYVLGNYRASDMSGPVFTYPDVVVDPYSGFVSDAVISNDGKFILITIKHSKLNEPDEYQTQVWEKFSLN